MAIVETFGAPVLSGIPFSLNPAPSPHEPCDSFIVQKIGACRVVYGSIPGDWTSMLFAGLSKDAVMAGVNTKGVSAMVFGEREDVERFCKDLQQVSG